MTTDLFAQLTAAEAAYAAAAEAAAEAYDPKAPFDAEADDRLMVLLRTLEAAERAYYGAVAEARAAWVALRDSDAKFSAETNAEDTEGCAEDELYWLEIALRTYEIAKNDGYAT